MALRVARGRAAQAVLTCALVLALVATHACAALGTLGDEADALGERWREVEPRDAPRGKRVWRHDIARATLVRDRDAGLPPEPLPLAEYARALGFASAPGVASAPAVGVHAAGGPRVGANTTAAAAAARRLLATDGDGGDHEALPMPAEEWRMIPEFVGSARADAAAPALRWNVSSYRTPCYSWTAARIGALEGPAADDGTYSATLTLETPEPTGGPLCGDWYAMLTTTGWHVERLGGRAGAHTVRWEGLSASEADELRQDGVRLFHFQEDARHLVSATFETLLLFVGVLTQPVDSGTAARNAAFLRDYVGIDMRPRAGEAARTRVPAEADVQSGDYFCIVRLDGLDPLIMWGTGSYCGHSVMALRFGGELYIVESQTKSNYWPTNFVQRTPYAQWMAQAQAASYNVLHLRLSASHAKLFAQREGRIAEVFANEHEGRLYGYVNMHFTFLDLGNENLPSPADWRLVACGFALIDPLLDRAIARASPDLPIPSLWNSALSKRLGLQLPNDLETAALLKVARERNLTFLDLVRMPEQDDWEYPGAPNGAYPAGLASVCDTFVCGMWKEAGFFDGVEGGASSVQCTEFTPVDLTELAVFDTSAEPKQVMGDYEMMLRHWSEVEPFAHMRERCPSKPPLYERRFEPHVQATC